MRSRASRGREGPERGVVLLWTLVVLLVLGGLIAAGVASDQALDRSARYELSVRGQARAVAEAGLVDAFAWFRRQQVQPVTTFAPRLDLGATPPVNETDDPAIGLVRDYEIAPNLWGRYEVRRTVPAEPFTDADGDGLYDEGESFTDTDGDGERDSAGGTRDVSEERGLPGSGVVWRIESQGTLFARPRGDLPLGTPPNDRIARVAVATEIRRLSVTPPSAASLCAANASTVTIGVRSRLSGGTAAGIAYASGTGSPTILAGSEVTGAPATTAQPDYDGSVEGVFGVTVSELRSMADVSTSDPTAISSPIGEHTLNVVEGNATFDAARPLRGTGVVVVLGDCTISSGSNSFFNGLLWVQGRLTVRAPCYLRGVLVVGGVADVAGTGGDYAEVNHDDGVIGELLRTMGQYRHSKSIYVPAGDGEGNGAEVVP
jgi:hypothetical protein